MKNIKIWILVALIAVVSIAIIIKTNKPESTETIKIGAALGLTGDAADWASPALNGAKLAVAEINEKGGVNGKQIELVVEDTKSTSKDTVSAVTKLQNIDGAKAMLVTWLDVYQGAESALNEGSFIISPDAGIEAVNGSKINPRVYSTWYRTQPKSELAVKHMAQNGVKTLYIIAENDSYYMSVVGFMKEAAKKYGIEVVGEELPLDADALKTVLTKANAKNPDAIFFAFYDNQKNLEFLTKYKGFTKPDVKIYGDEFVKQNYSSKDFPANVFEGIYFYSPAKPETKFYESYKTAYNQEPIFGASTAYDAVYMAAQILEKSPKNIDEYVRSAKFETASYGQVTIDSIGGVQSVENYFEIKQIVNGQVVTK